MSTHLSEVEALPPSNAAEPLTLLLRGRLPQLRPAERRVASYVIDHPDKARHLAITALALVAGVSVASVTRLTKAVGCTGYTDFRRRLIEDVVRSDVQHLEPVRESTAAPTSAHTIAEIVDSVFRLSVQSLVETLQVLDMAAMERAADVLAQANTVYCFGIGSSSTIAVDAAYRLLRVGVAAHAEVDAHLQVARMALLTSGDAAIALSFSGETQETVDAAEAARRAGATLIVVTNFPHSRLGRLADVCLYTASRQPLWRQDAVPVRVVQLTVLDALCVCLLRRNSARAERAARLIDYALVSKGVHHLPSLGATSDDAGEAVGYTTRF